MNPNALDLKRSLTELDNYATPGRWGQWHPKFMPEARNTPFHEWDTSHHSSALLPDGERYRLGEWQHANDAAFAEALVNAWREGRIKVVPSPTPEEDEADAPAPAREDGP